MTRPDIRGIGLVLLDRMMTVWLGSQHGPDPDPVMCTTAAEAQREHAALWASWRRARAKR